MRHAAGAFDFSVLTPQRSRMLGPKVSIIIPTKDRADLLAGTVASIEAQTYSNIEALVVDDHSTDSTASLMRETMARDNRFQFIPLPADRNGAPAARNEGVRRSTGEFVIFLDSDDLIAPHCIEQRVRIITERPDLDFAVFPCQVFLDRAGDTQLLWNIDGRGDDIDRFLDLDVPWQTTSPIWRRDSLVKVGDWDEDAMTAQDWEFHIRAIARGLKYQRFGKPDCFWRKPSAKRESIGKSSALEPKHIRSRLQVAARVATILDQQDLLNPKRRRILGGLFFRVCERLAEKASRRDARQCWKQARELKLLSLWQFGTGELYFCLFRWTLLRRMLRAALEIVWPAELIKRPTTMLQCAPMPRELAEVKSIAPASAAVAKVPA
jgi:hypothetical protein